MIWFMLLTLACGTQSGTEKTDRGACELVATGALPEDDALDPGLLDGIARYATLGGTWDVSLSCADGSTESATVAITLAEREDLVLETWDGDACEGTSRISGPSAVRISGWTHELDATIDTGIEQDGGVRLSGSASSVAFELLAWAAGIRGTVRVPWPEGATADEVGSISDEVAMDCTFEGWSPVE